ncbi:hypothetical protein NED98_05730 [Sphingomonas sp. MMSM20]|uniref:DUF6551 family protein n=1 Tax=Sphingomonas lycopersici TaxID=2951807 RepID=UPI002237D827|nr:DUF6551 family protein [Sphingomonas lycopersici]MCW6529740.1 hypothetical protein [Sphingomonas lycopersici]
MKIARPRDETFHRQPILRLVRLEENMSQQNAAASTLGTQLWRNDGGSLPDWLRPMVLGSIEANGTFLIASPLGHQRVHRGYVVVEQCGDVYAWPAEEVDERVAEMKERSIAASKPVNMVGPGKSLKTAIPSRKRQRGKQETKRARTYPPVRGVPPSIEWVSVDDLRVDGDYQRSIENEPSRRLVASIAAHWDWRLCMPLAVSRRVDGRYVIDGQHRLAAARMRKDIIHLPCSIGTYDGVADEAAMFVAANRARRAINRLDDFHAALVAGDEDALEINRVVETAGLRVARQTGSQAWRPGEVAFTSSVAAVMGRNGEELVIDALSAIAEAFQGQVLTNGASVFLGLTRIMASPPEGLDRKRLLRSLAAFDMRGWGSFVQGVKGGDVRAQAMRLAILEAYNDPATMQRIAA